MKVKTKAHSKQSDPNRQELTISDSRGQKADEDNGDLGLSLLAAKTIDEFK